MVQVNEELTAEEWKRRWEKEREKVIRLRAALSAAEKELERWRKGQSENLPDFVRNGQKIFLILQAILYPKTNGLRC